CWSKCMPRWVNEFGPRCPLCRTQCRFQIWFDLPTTKCSPGQHRPYQRMIVECQKLKMTGGEKLWADTGVRASTCYRGCTNGKLEGSATRFRQILRHIDLSTSKRQNSLFVSTNANGYVIRQYLLPVSASRPYTKLNSLEVVSHRHSP